MEVLKIGEDRATMELTYEEIGYLEEALHTLDKHPTSEGGNYKETINRLYGGFDMMRQLNELAEAKKGAKGKPATAA